MSITTTPQKAKVYAIFDDPPTVFACRVNQSFKTHDKVYEFAYDTPTGTLANVKPGMTILLGSTAGAYNKGITYVRKAPTSTKIYCGETSEVAWADNLYVTILQDFCIWPEYLLISSDGTVFMKHDVKYVDQHTNMRPVPIIGPDRVAKYEGSPVTVSFDGSDSYVPGSTIASHAFTCSGGSISGANTATPAVTLSAPGRYLLTYTVTSALGVSSTTYRVIYIANSAMLVEVVAGTITGSYSDGGYSFGIAATNVPLTARVRTKVVLFAEEWYGNAKISYGPYAGAENIPSEGWMADEAITIDETQGTASVNVKSTQYWMQQIHNFVPAGIKSVTGTPAKWIEIKNLTVDLMLWHFFMWRSTASNCVDIFLTGDTRTATELDAPAGNLWEQIKTIAYQSILAIPCCDQYGRIFVEVEPALMHLADRDNVPVIASVDHDDWESISIERPTVTKTAQVVLSGVSVTSNVGKSKYSLSPGHIPQHYGTVLSADRLLLSTQALSNELAGNMLEKENMPYRFDIKNILYNNRLVGICPRQFIDLTVEEADSLRDGIDYSGNAIVKTVEWTLSDGAWDINWTVEPETKSRLSTNGDIPVVPDDEDPSPHLNIPIPSTPPIDGIVPDPMTPIPLLPDPSGCTLTSPATAYRLTWDRTFINGIDGTNSTIAWKLCTIRASGADNPTAIEFTGTFTGQAPLHLHCDAIDGAEGVLASGTVSYTGTEDLFDFTITFSESSALSVNGFRLWLDVGMDTTPASLFIGDMNPSDPLFDIFSDVVNPGGALSHSTHVVNYDQAGGSIETYTTATGHAGVLSCELWGRMNLWSDPGSEGDMYLSLAFAGTSSGTPIYFEFSSIAKAWLLPKVGLIDTESGPIGISGTPTQFLFKVVLPYGCSAADFIISMRWYYSGTIPARSLTIGSTTLYNVCPTE
jgi:hypothetical protein